MDNPIRTCIVIASSAVVVGTAIRSMIHTHQVETAKRQQIETDLQLDLKAIRQASEMMHEFIDRGDIRSLTQLAETLQTEIAFQKIAVRED